MVDKINKLKTFVNSANTTLLFFVVLCLFYLHFIVTGNEEIYMGLARSYYSPDWLPDSFVYDHWVSHRFVFEIIFGFLISFLGFETVVFLGRLLACGIFAWSLARYFRQIKLTNLESLLVLVVFITVGQNLLPGEWIFLSVEPKVFAYPIIFLAMTELSKGKPKIAALYIIAATYLHVLVAGWFFVYFICYLLWNKFPLRDLAKISCLYLAGVLPLLLFLAPKIFSGPSDINGMHLNWIYVFYRVPDQAPFINGNLNVGRGWQIRKFITIIAYFILAIVIHRKKNYSPDIKLFNDFNIIIPSFLLTFLVVCYFDRTGDILKFRPFRGVSLYLFFILTEMVLLSKQFLTRQKVASTVSHIFVVVLAILITFGTGRNIVKRYINPFLLKDQKQKAWEETITFAKGKTEKKSIFFINGINERIWWSFSRYTDRDMFVSKKFVPVDKNKWYEWYQRIHLDYNDEKKLAALKKEYKLGYYLTLSTKPYYGKVVFQNSHFVISRLNE